eukprot:s2900_g11.t1
MPLTAGENRGDLLSERLPKPATLSKPHSTPVGAYERMADHARKAMFCRGPQKCIAEKRMQAKLQLAGQENCGRRLAFQTLLHFTALQHAKIPLVSFLALRSVLQNAFIRDMSIQPRSCTLQADSGFQSVLCEESVQPPSSLLAPADRPPSSRLAPADRPPSSRLAPADRPPSSRLAPADRLAFRASAEASNAFQATLDSGWGLRANG